MEADSSEDRAHLLQAQLQEFQSKVDSMESEKRTLLELNKVFKEQINRQPTFREQVAYVPLHPASIMCFLVIILGGPVAYWIQKLNSENLLLRQQIAFANERKEFLQSEIESMRDEFKEKYDKAITVRLQENQFNLEGMNYLVRCLRDENSASERFTGINLFWGAVQVGYTTRSGLDNCLTMYQAQYPQQISYT